MFKVFCIMVSLLIVTSTLAACGFELRGQATLPFKSIYLQGGELSISKALRKNLKANDIIVLPTADNADVLVEFANEETVKKILSLSGGGVVKEYELFYRIHYRIRGFQDAVWGPEQTIETRRDFSYSDAELLAKQGEEVALYENMHSDVVNNLIRRLTHYKPAHTTKDDVNANP